MSRAGRGSQVLISRRGRPVDPRGFDAPPLTCGNSLSDVWARVGTLHCGFRRHRARLRSSRMTRSRGTTANRQGFAKPSEHIQASGGVVVADRHELAEHAPTASAPRGSREPPSRRRDSSREHAKALQAFPG